MTVAYIVIAHQDPPTLAALLDELAPSPTFVHVDRAALNPRYRNLSRIDGRPQVTLSSAPRCVHWGGFSVLQAVFETLELALADTDQETGHFVVLSGQCLPLRPTEQFQDYLESTPTPVLCRGYSMSEHPDVSMGMRRLTERHWLDGAVGHLRKTTARAVGGTVRRGLFVATRSLPVRLPDITHACGSGWVALPRRLSLELVAHYRNGGFDYLRNSYAPDEIAIPSYVFNSEWATLTPAGGLERADGATVASYANFHWLRGTMQGLVTDDDLVQAGGSGKFFIRKVSVGRHGAGMQRIRETW